MMIVFFAATFFLCSFLITMFINADNSDILRSFSEDAKYIVINQNENSGSALAYSDVARLLSKYRTKGAVKIELYNKSGYMLYNYRDNENPGGAGHARTSTTTDIYSHFLKSSDKTAAEKLEQLFE